MTPRASHLCRDWKLREGASLCPPAGVCVECGAEATAFVTWAAVYRTVPPHGREGALFLLCACGAFVGCQEGTRTPLGRPGGPNTRKWRIAAHAAFDPLWQAKVGDALNRFEAREAGYRWLAEQLGLPRSGCHISHMGAETARQVAVLCAPYAARLRARREHVRGTGTGANA